MRLPAEEVSSPAGGLDDLFGKLSIADTATTDDIPSNVEVIDDTLPPTASNVPVGAPDIGIIMEVMVIGDSQGAGGSNQDLLEAAIHALLTSARADAS